MAKLFLSPLVFFQALCLLQCAAQTSAVFKEEHFFETFLDPTIPFEFVKEEHLFIVGYINITKMDNFVKRANIGIDDDVNKLIEMGESILGKIKGLDKDAYVKIGEGFFSKDVDIFSTEDGYYRQLGYFYINRYSDSDFYLGKRVAENLDELYKEAKENQGRFAILKALSTKCYDQIGKILQFWLVNEYPSKEIKHRDIGQKAPVFIDCDEANPKTKALFDDAKDGARKLVSILLRNSLYLYYHKISFALDFSTYHSFNGQQSAPEGAQLGTLELMLYETNKTGLEIQKSLEKLQRKSSSSPEAKNLFQDLVGLLKGNDPAWDLLGLYSLDPESITFSRDLVSAWEKNIAALRNHFLGPGNNFLDKYKSTYKHDVNAFYEDAVDSSFKITYYNPILTGHIYVFFSNWAGTPAELYARAMSGYYNESLGDANFNKAIDLQRLFLSWKRLKRFNAKIQCHMKNNYWFFHRNKALQASQQPLWRIFGGISKTLFRPCVHNDTDLVGTCTAANHEVCRPIMYTEKLMEKIDENEESAQFYYKPEYVFRPTIMANGTIQCDEIETYVPPMNVCRCGFRLDCGTDLGKNLTCVLQVEDNFRKRCRGSIGYPCKTLPLGPGRHHESCVTGYCNMRLNSCEYDDKQYPIVWSGVHRDDEI